MGEIAKRVQEMTQNWYGHMMRREDHYVGRRTIEMEVQERGGREEGLT